jgi:hypothetical protein
VRWQTRKSQCCLATTIIPVPVRKCQPLCRQYDCGPLPKHATSKHKNKRRVAGKLRALTSGPTPDRPGTRQGWPAVADYQSNRSRLSERAGPLPPRARPGRGCFAADRHGRLSIPAVRAPTTSIRLDSIKLSASVRKRGLFLPDWVVLKFRLPFLHQAGRTTGVPYVAHQLPVSHCRRALPRIPVGSSSSAFSTSGWRPCTRQLGNEPRRAYSGIRPPMARSTPFRQLHRTWIAVASRGRSPVPGHGIVPRDGADSLQELQLSDRLTYAPVRQSSVTKQRIVALPRRLPSP